MIQIASIKVDSRFSTGFVVVSWTVASTTETIALYTFAVLRSISPESGFVTLANGLTTFQYQDTTINLLQPYEVYYYKIQVTSSVDASTSLSTVYGSTRLTESDPVADSITYQEQYLLQYINRFDPTRKARVLLKIRTGPKCTNCWDPLTKQITKSNCQVCYLTGYQGGYMPQINVYVSMATSPENVVSGDVVYERQEPIASWLSNYPILQPEDIVVDYLGNRYTIIDVQYTTKDRYILSQRMTMQHIPPADIVYKFPVT